ncbi:MAG: glycosyltransferase family 2 protein [Patescibacteria group bacterium]
MEKIKCSVPILTLNAAAHLEECLTSVRDFADVFLLDGNSTDATISIARQHSIPVHRQVDSSESNIKISNFSAMRLKAEQLSRFDWVLGLDADEFVSPSLVEEIRAILNNADIKRVFTMPKVAIMGQRIVRYSFNSPDHAPRLYHRQSGVKWKSSKLVHEKLYIPDDVRVIKLAGEVYSYVTDSYRAAVKKDNYYLSLTRQKMFAPGQSRLAKRAAFRSFGLNFLRAGNVLYKSLKVYWRHGFRHSLPPQHVWRYIRYHLFICWYCLWKIATYH